MTKNIQLGEGMSELFQRVEKCIEGYACGCPFANVYGCTDCLNTGYLFDNEEIYLLMEVSELAQKLQKENDVLRKEYNKILDALSECEDKRCRVIEEKKEMRLEIERMRVRLKKEEEVDE